jgi:phosphoribosylaminoimidazolecarboxamide formyltransferase/IMP cyclohydrolase
MRYGENPHQSAAFYIEKNITEACVASSRQCQGKKMSYNNMADADAALECVRSFNEPARTFLASLSTFGAMITSTNWRSIMACAVFSFSLTCVYV